MESAYRCSQEDSRCCWSGASLLGATRAVFYARRSRPTTRRRRFASGPCRTLRKRGWLRRPLSPATWSGLSCVRRPFGVTTHTGCRTRIFAVRSRIPSTVCRCSFMVPRQQKRSSRSPQRLGWSGRSGWPVDSRVGFRGNSCFCSAIRIGQSWHACRSISLLRQAAMRLRSCKRGCSSAPGAVLDATENKEDL